MGLMWIVVGVLAGLSSWGLYELNKRFNITTLAWAGLISGIFLVLFGIAWSVSAVVEGVPRSGSMGAILFDGLGLVILVLTFRLDILKNKEKTDHTTIDSDSGESNSDIEGSTRRQFLGLSVIGALNAKRIIGGALGLGAVATSVAAIKKVKGKILNDVPNEINEYYKRMDQRGVIQGFVHSPKLQEENRNWVETWERIAKERGKDFKVEGSYEKYVYGNPRDEVGYRQLDYALARGAWETSLRGIPITVAPNHGVQSWDQSQVNKVKYKFKTKLEAAFAIKNAAKLYGSAKTGITFHDKRWDYDPLYDPIDEKTVSWDDFPFKPKTVIVCLVEMDYLALSTAPSIVSDGPSGQGYSDMVMVSSHLAAFLRQLGYNAVASGNDLGLSVAYAVAAGLGEVSRGGWLISPDLGPKVRICKIYTDFDFVEYDKPRDYSITNFCVKCKRCADACPSQAISFDDEPTFKPVYEHADDPNYNWSSHPGVLLWHNNSKKCYEYWVENGGSCSSCIAACPYNKPDFWHHDLVDTSNVISPGPVHTFMKEMDKVFGYGNVNDPSKVHKFWESENW
jgi:reductive dehalogenase